LAPTSSTPFSVADMRHFISLSGSTWLLLDNVIAVTSASLYLRGCTSLRLLNGPLFSFHPSSRLIVYLAWISPRVIHPSFQHI
jgi:hypothetical protein